MLIFDTTYNFKIIPISKISKLKNLSIVIIEKKI